MAPRCQALAMITSRPWCVSRCCTMLPAQLQDQLFAEAYRRCDQVARLCRQRRCAVAAVFTNTSPFSDRPGGPLAASCGIRDIHVDARWRAASQSPPRRRPSHTGTFVSVLTFGGGEVERERECKTSVTGCSRKIQQGRRRPVGSRRWWKRQDHVGNGVVLAGRAAAGLVSISRTYSAQLPGPQREGSVRVLHHVEVPPQRRAHRRRSTLRQREPIRRPA